MNFPIEKMQDDWWVELNNGTKALWRFNEATKQEVKTAKLTPNHLYKWDKGTVPPIAKGVKWVAFSKQDSIPIA